MASGSEECYGFGSGSADAGAGNNVGVDAEQDKSGLQCQPLMYYCPGCDQCRRKDKEKDDRDQVAEEDKQIITEAARQCHAREMQNL